MKWLLGVSRERIRKRETIWVGNIFVQWLCVNRILGSCSAGSYLNDDLNQLVCDRWHCPDVHICWWSGFTSDNKAFVEEWYSDFIDHICITVVMVCKNVTCYQNKQVNIISVKQRERLHGWQNIWRKCQPDRRVLVTQTHWPCFHNQETQHAHLISLYLP